MARKTSKKEPKAEEAEPTAQDNINSLLKKKEVWIAIGSALGIFVVVGIVIVKSYNPPAQLGVTTDQITPSPQPSEQVESLEVKTPDISQITKLADTSAKVAVIVQKGDSFWKLGKTYCGSSTAGASLKVSSGYQDKNLHPGDKIIISCPD